MFTVRFVQNTDKVARMMQHLKEPRGGYEAIGEAMVERVSSTFDQSAGPWGGAWRQWSPTTVDLYDRGGLFKNMRSRPERILLNTGTLRNSVHHEAHRDRVTIKAGGAASAYASVHQFGNPGNRLPNRAGGAHAPIPARPFMPVTSTGKARLPAEWRKLAVEAFEDWLEAGAP